MSVKVEGIDCKWCLLLCVDVVISWSSSSLHDFRVGLEYMRVCKWWFFNFLQVQVHRFGWKWSASIFMYIYVVCAVVIVMLMYSFFCSLCWWYFHENCYVDVPFFLNQPFCNGKTITVTSLFLNEKFYAHAFWKKTHPYCNSKR